MHPVEPMECILEFCGETPSDEIDCDWPFPVDGTVAIGASYADMADLQFERSLDCATENEVDRGLTLESCEALACVLDNFEDVYAIRAVGGMGYELTPNSLGLITDSPWTGLDACLSERDTLLAEFEADCGWVPTPLP